MRRLCCWRVAQVLFNLNICVLFCCVCCACARGEARCVFVEVCRASIACSSGRARAEGWRECSQGSRRIEASADADALPVGGRLHPHPRPKLNNGTKVSLAKRNGPFSYLALDPRLGPDKTHETLPRVLHI